MMSHCWVRVGMPVDGPARCTFMMTAGVLFIHAAFWLSSVASTPIDEEHLQVSMAVMYDQSVPWRRLPAGTGNKTETLLGYTTIFGDNAAASDPHTDFSVNANGTLTLLESALADLDRLDHLEAGDVGQFAQAHGRKRTFARGGGEQFAVLPRRQRRPGWTARTGAATGSRSRCTGRAGCACASAG